MNKEFEKRVHKLVGKWARKMGLADYTFSLEFKSETAMGGDYARVETDEDLREASITFNESRLLKEPKEVEHTVIHELLHVRLNEYYEFAKGLVDNGSKDQRAKRVLRRLLDKQDHKVVVALTDAICGEKRK